MMSHWDLDNSQLETEFESGALNPSIMNHEAHLRLAFIHLNKYGLHKAVENLCEQIARFDKIHGKSNKFSSTVTASAVFVINQFLMKCQTRSFSRFINTYPELKYDFKELIGEITLNKS